MTIQGASGEYLHQASKIFIVLGWSQPNSSQANDHSRAFLWQCEIYIYHCSNIIRTLESNSFRAEDPPIELKMIGLQTHV